MLLRVEKLGDETFLARIRHLVEQSLAQPTEIEKRADILASRLTKLGLLATGLTFLFTRNLSRAFSVLLVMACPCATVLAASTAIAAADIALLKSDLADLVFLLRLGEKTLQIVEQNFWIATLTNLLGILLAAGGWMPPVITGTLHVVHSLGILLNSGRILRWEAAPEAGIASSRMAQ